MNTMIIEVTSSYGADGFNIFILNKKIKQYAFGYNASYKRDFAEKNKPYAADIINNYISEYSIDSITVRAGMNGFTGNKVGETAVNCFKKILNDVKIKEIEYEY